MVMAFSVMIVAVQLKRGGGKLKEEEKWKSKYAGKRKAFES